LIALRKRAVGKNVRISAPKSSHRRELGMSIEFGRTVAPIVATAVLASLAGAAWSQQDPRPAPASAGAAEQ